jgi:hypothetical protein
MERLVPFIAYLKVSIFTSKWKLSASTSITGNVSGVANISNVIIKTYAIGDKAIWGRIFMDKSGNIGDFDTSFFC